MKALFILVLFFTNLAYAGLKVCPQHLQSQQRSQKIIDFLNSVSGRHHAGNCRIEIHSCHGFSDATNDAVGDILVTSRDGRETFMTIYLPKTQTPKITVTDQISDRMYHYEFQNLVGGATTGRMELNKLEIVRNPKSGMIKTLTMGTYNTRDAIKHLNEYALTWNECF